MIGIKYFLVTKLYFNRPPHCFGAVRLHNMIMNKH